MDQRVYGQNHGACAELAGSLFQPKWVRDLLQVAEVEGDTEGQELPAGAPPYRDPMHYDPGSLG